jgi:tetratricopeptide (TPR) repeat protein
VAQSVADPEKGLASLNKAIALRPDFAGARSARGALHYQQGNADAALPDLEFAAAKTPDSALVLDRLGQTYQLLDRPQDAVRVLRRAAQLAPSDAKTQLHTANALAQAGETAESKTYMNRYRELGGTAAVPARGVMEYLSRTPEQQRAAYRARIEKGMADRPDDAELQVAFLKLSIGEGHIDRATATARKVLAMKPGGILLTDAGHAMFSARQYPLAKELLEQAMAVDPAAGVELELAIAVFRTDGAAAGLQRMDRIPDSARGGDYWAARAEMLSPNDAVAAMKQAIRTEPERTDLYWQATALLLKNRRAAEALQLISLPAVPDNSQIAVMRAMLLELTGKTQDAQKLLADAQRRWPEAAPIWIAKGSIQSAHGQAVAAKKSIGTAAALGAHNAATIPTPEKLFLSNPPQNW